MGQHIKKLRKDKGFTQESFALEAGVERAYYGKIEAGQRNLTALNIMKIALALDVEPGELLPSKSELKTIESRINNFNQSVSSGSFKK